MIRRRASKVPRVKREWISNKIQTLRHEGYPPKQAVAIAYRMAGVSRRSSSSSHKRLAPSRSVRRSVRRDVDTKSLHAAFAKADRLLSSAESAIGSELTTELRHGHPSVFQAADEAYDLIERARRLLARRHR